MISHANSKMYTEIQRKNTQDKPEEQRGRTYYTMAQLIIKQQ